MPIFIIILIIIVFIRTVSYGIYELKENKNLVAGITTFFLSIVGLIFPIFEIIINYYI